MGREVVKAVSDADGMALVAAIDAARTGEDAGSVAGIAPLGVPVESDLGAALRRNRAEVLVDFTVPSSAFGNLKMAIECRAAPVVGTTGLSSEEVVEAGRLAKAAKIGALIAPNFAIGAVLMMEFAAKAARHLPDVEIIELHHERKLDAPSGTAWLTAERIAAARADSPAPMPSGAHEKAQGARGGEVAGIRVHSVRLPGLVAHQEVIFGGPGQTLRIRHDSLDRASFMPGVILAVRRVSELDGLVIGLENLLR